MLFLHFLLLLGHFDVGTSSLKRSKNALSGKHLRVIWPRWEGNPKGLSGPLKGGVILDYLSSRFNFTYNMIRVTENSLEPNAIEKGLFSYVLNGECDLLLQNVLPTLQRFKLVDIVFPWYTSDVLALLIPVPDDTLNVYAVVKPFQFQVWYSLVISIAVVIITLKIIERLLTKVPYPSSEEESSGSNLIGTQFLYVFGNILSQGGPCQSSRLPFRMIAGVWTLAAFVFVQAYTSTLFTYVIKPSSSAPLVDSVFDLANKSDINLLVKKGGDLEASLTSKRFTSPLHGIGYQRLVQNPESRCVLVSDCINRIPGSKNVFGDAKNYLLDAIKERFEKTGKCDMQLARNGFLPVISSYALPLKSPYTRLIAIGMLELKENGLYNHWETWFRRMPRQCLKNIDGNYVSNSQDTSTPRPVSLNNLTGAFVILIGGFSLSFLVFLFELVYARKARLFAYSKVCYTSFKNCWKKSVQCCRCRFKKKTAGKVKTVQVIEQREVPSVQSICGSTIQTTCTSEVV